MRIIKEGILPGEKEHRHTCSSCRTIFEFQEKEATSITYDQREGTNMKITCPFCEKVCYHYPGFRPDPY